MIKIEDNRGKQVPCAQGWSSIDGSCHMAFGEEVTWFEAEGKCQRLDGHLVQGCKMDCENCDNCEIANCDCEKNTISQLTQFSFLNTVAIAIATQFVFSRRSQFRNCEKIAKVIFYWFFIRIFQKLFHRKFFKIRQFMIFQYFEC